MNVVVKEGDMSTQWRDVHNLFCNIGSPSVSTATGKPAIVVTDSYAQNFISMSRVRTDKTAGCRIHELDTAVLTSTQDVAAPSIVSCYMRWTFYMRPRMQQLRHRMLSIEQQKGSQEARKRRCTCHTTVVLDT